MTFQNAVSLREIYLHVIAAICYLTDSIAPHLKDV